MPQPSRPGPTEPPKTVLHLGAHKTATTFIQKVLSLNADALRRRGTAVLLPEHLRGDPDLAYASTGDADRDAQVHRTRARFDTLLRGARAPRVVLSEEGLLGSSRMNLTARALYPDPGPRLSCLPPDLDSPDTEICLSIRSYDSFFAANISTVARRGKLFAFDDLRASLLALARGWPDVLADIRAHFPNARLTVWQYEDFTPHRDAILRHLAGGPVNFASADRVNRSLSARAMTELAALADSRGNLPGGPGAARKLARAFPSGAQYPSYSPWSPEDAATLRAAYDRHWQQIRDTHPDACLWT
ncbi:hypothetical protein [Chachezhania antarctica]|uniref:hypothetical protein n=1 Tax=Chachezhania antarctica TaxID=2340860 RepID=UPI0013CEDEB6|nr:hypothetical protein [Chachezhania antarctica]|tara:strand:+ start:264 stop:1169 length:906 start_codon:yes stop_codon:yes gene_type:complete